MKQPARRALPLFAVYSAAAALAQAHPGHEGHEGGEFTWDFSHLASNLPATLGYVALLAVAVWTVRSYLPSRRRPRVQSIRRSTDSHGN